MFSVARWACKTFNCQLSTINCQLSTNSGLCPETHSLFCPRQVAMFHLIQKTKEKKSRLRLFSGKCIVKSWKCWKRNVVGGSCETINCQFSTINSIKTRSDKSDLKQHSFLTAHFTAFFGYINEVAYLVESWKWTVESFARETLNEQRSILNTINCQLSTINSQLSNFILLTVCFNYIKFFVFVNK